MWTSSFIFREVEYDKKKKGNFLLMFRHNGKALCVDATAEDETFGRLINHSRSDPNLVMKIVVVENVPRVIFFALKNIEIGHELCYDYGEKRKDILKKFPWLK